MPGVGWGFRDLCVRKRRPLGEPSRARGCLRRNTSPPQMLENKAHSLPSGNRLGLKPTERDQGNDPGGHREVFWGGGASLAPRGGEPTGMGGQRADTRGAGRGVSCVTLGPPWQDLAPQQPCTGAKREPVFGAERPRRPVAVSVSELPSGHGEKIGKLWVLLGRPAARSRATDQS